MLESHEFDELLGDAMEAAEAGEGHRVAAIQAYPDPDYRQGWLGDPDAAGHCFSAMGASRLGEPITRHVGIDIMEGISAKDAGAVLRKVADSLEGPMGEKIVALAQAGDPQACAESLADGSVRLLDFAVEKDRLWERLLRTTGKST